ncbi:hypothetical protein [Streptomyces mirabilis]|uniref:hypothetical protein n=1 Tax=Streptomyces mirabilis TaxID=68239 RepID=UPI0022520ECA|nr:hypothetical protein [Streptomyces mirabilis]MCX4428690.1 hypothetical protein [Streptomyces mirabilis]
MAGRSGDRPAARGDFGHRLSARLSRMAPGAGGPALESRSVGTALLVHPRGFVDSRALNFTRRLAADPQHTLVVLDLPASPEDAVWDKVARSLARRGGSFRIVPGRGTREDVKQAAQLLADRLQRVVLAPDGTVVPAAGGALFVPASHGLGWLRYRPGMPSVPESRRFPKPQWEFSVPDQPRPTGAGGMVEPLPGGAWIRGTWEDAAAPEHRQWLIDQFVGHPDQIGVALGSPGTSALPLEEVSAFWDTLPPTARPMVRFLPYGPVAVPSGTPLGQALADLLGEPVVVHAGVPTPGADGGAPVVRTIGRDGRLSWRPYAEQFGFLPRSQTGGRAQAPLPLNTRVPVGDIPAIGHGVYQYAPDVVLEVVQSGLWVRPAVEPPDRHTVRSAPADPVYPAILYDETNPMAADRMRYISYELLRGLDPSFGRQGRIMPSSEAGRFPEGGPPPLPPGGPVPAAPGPADGRVLEAAPRTEGTAPSPLGQESAWTDLPAARTQEAAPAPGRPAQPPQRPDDLPPSRVPTSQPGPEQPAPQLSVVPTARPVAGPGLPALPPVATGRAAVPPPHETAVPAAPSAPAAPDQTNSPPPVPTDPPPSAPVPPAPVPTDPPPSAPAIPPVPGSPSPSVPTVSPSAEPTHVPPPAPEPAPAPGPASAPGPSGAPRIRLESPSPQPVRPAPQPPAAAADAAEDDALPAPQPVAAPPPVPSRPQGGDTPRVQPSPAPAADVVPPEKGIDRERDWVRRSLGARYDTAAAFVTRLLSESPGLHGGPRNSASDALTDLAAVRLYLSGATPAIDAAIRAAATGPHVPLSRCAATGLRRLPSYRGGALLRATLSAAERAWYRESMAFTERSFLSALSAIRRDLTGNTDILIWSLTARRTALVLPEIADRVVFPPGTGFKVLRTVDGDRPAIMLRELSMPEVDEQGRIGEGRVPLDEIALAGLEQIHAFWKQAGDDPERTGDPLPDAYAEAFRAAPGLLQTPPRTPDGPRQPESSAGTLPQKGA